MSQPVLETPQQPPNGSTFTLDSGSTTTTTTNSSHIPAKVVGASDPRMYTEEDIEKAREQEKSKMYRRLETMQETVTRLEAEAKDRQQAEEKAQQDAQAEAEKQAEEQMSFKELLEKRDQEWQARLDAVQQGLDTEKALRERETRFAELLDYRQQVVQQYSDRVAPQLLDLIMGETQEEIVASAEDLAARSSQILAQTAEAMKNARQQTPTSRITVPASGENSGTQRMYTPDEIRSMSMADYAKQRRSLLGGGADGTTNRGLFG